MRITSDMIAQFQDPEHRAIMTAALENEERQKAEWNLRVEQVSRKKRLPRISYEEACEYLYTWHDSYSRFGALLPTFHALSRKTFWRLMGEVWSGIDNIAQYPEEFKFLFKQATRKDLDLMMSADERAFLKSLPEVISAYRGCYRDNIDGFSYSLDRDIAEKFCTFYQRYRRADQQPLLVVVEIPKSSVVIKLDREEQEVIATNRSLIRRVDLIELSPSKPCRNADATVTARGEGIGIDRL